MHLAFDDLLGGDAGDYVLPPAPEQRISLRTADAHEVQRGVTVQWLQTVFGLSRAAVVSRLELCPALRVAQGGSKVYDLRVAAAYLVKPRINLAEYLRKLEPKDMPEQLRKEFWAAKLAEQKWRKQAGELWHDDDVMAVFGEVFKTIKTTAQLWVEGLAESIEIDDEQRAALTSYVDSLLEQLHKSLVDLAGVQETRSQLAELDDDFPDVQES